MPEDIRVVPDPFRLRHRQALREVVSDIIREKMNQKDAASRIAAWSAVHISETDRARFIEIAETELMSIHEGNFARYQIRPSEYHAWQTVWHQKPRGQ
jgi:hypothetical protein